LGGAGRVIIFNPFKVDINSKSGYSYPIEHALLTGLFFGLPHLQEVWKTNKQKEVVMMFADQAQTLEPNNGGVLSTIYNYIASGADAIGAAILMDGVSPPGFETDIQHDRVTIEFAKTMGHAEPDEIVGLTGDVRSAAQLRMFRGMMRAAGLSDDQVVPGETPDQAVLIRPTNNALRVAKYDINVGRMSPPQWTL
jgi:hypothetical protein